MIKHISEENLYVRITGFQNVEVENAKELLRAVRTEKRANIQVQFFNAGIVVTWGTPVFRPLKRIDGFQDQEKRFEKPRRRNHAVRFSSTSDQESYRTHWR